MTQPLVPSPPDPFDAATYVLAAGAVVHRVHRATRVANAFNPGLGGRSRFSPMTVDGTAVPTLYAAQSPEAAVCESLLHDVPVDGGRLVLQPGRDAGSALALRREVRLASLMGPGLRRLGVEHQDLIATRGDVYALTVAWAIAAHRAGFDGVVWMSARENTSQAYIFFGDRVREQDLDIIECGLGDFTPGTSGFDWLADFCTRVKVELLLA